MPYVIPFQPAYPAATAHIK
ncbi:hypothetical protein KIPB_013030, partial [Kipferlia bialata]|eukprot:g13030.t1